MSIQMINLVNDKSFIYIFGITSQQIDSNNIAFVVFGLYYMFTSFLVRIEKSKYQKYLKIIKHNKKVYNFVGIIKRHGCHKTY